MSDKLLRYAAPAAALPATLEGDELIRPGELARQLKIAVGTVYRWVKAGKIPRPRRLSHRVSGWTASEIRPIVRALGAESDRLAG